MGETRGHGRNEERPDGPLGSLPLPPLDPFIKAGLVLIPAGRPSRARASCAATRREDARQTSAKMS